MPTKEIEILEGTDDAVVHPSPCVVSPIAEAAFSMEGVAGGGFVSEPPGEATFEHTWEIVKRPIQSVSAESRTYYSSWTSFDPSKLDGATYILEAIAVNFHGSNTYNIYLCDDPSGSNIIATIPVDPTSGAKVFLETADITSVIEALSACTLTARLDQTAGDNELQCWRLRLRITQVNPTKTVLQFPFLNPLAISNQSYLVSGDNRFIIGGTFPPTAESNCCFFRKIANCWEADTANIVLETVAGNTAIIGSALSTYYVRDATSGLDIISNGHGIGGSGVELVRSTVPLSDFIDDRDFVIFSDNVASSASNTILLSISLFIELTNISIATVMRSLSSVDAQKLDANNFTATSGIVYKFAATGAGSAGNNLYVQYANDVTMAGAATLTGSPTLFEGAKAFNISSALTLIAGSKFYRMAIDGASEYPPGLILIQLTK